MNPPPLLSGALSVFLSAALAAGQTREVLVDFGEPAWTTGSRGVVWNDLHTGNVGAGLALLDSAGSPTGIRLDFTPGMTFLSANAAGVQSPDPGSPLAQLGWPASALRDTFYGSGSLPAVELWLSGLADGATYDLVIVASRLNVGDVRTTRYTADAHVTASATLDAANNASDYVVLTGLAPDAFGRIRLEVRADATNNNPSGFYYFNALGIREYAGGSQGPLIAFSSNRIDFSRVVGKGPFSGATSLYTNGGPAPRVSLSAIDDATGLPPTWLTFPSAGTAGAPIPLTVDADGLAAGSHSATLLASAPGHATASTSVRLAARAAGGYLNLLYYGNSYSIGNGTIGSFVRDLAEAAGFEPPNTVQRLVGGQNLAFHLNDPGQAAAITQSLPLGEEWDYVVLQGFSLEATVALGDPAQFVANAVAILGNVKAHSPGARAVLYQTWARGPGHSVYPGAFADPLEMHREVEDGYRAAESAMNAAFGHGSARRAAAGEAVALRNFDAALYTTDLSHPRPGMSVMAFSAVHASIYGSRACDVDPDFATPGNLGARLTGFGFGPVEWAELAGTADRVAVPWTRRRPGSSEDLLLLTGPAGLTNGCPLKSAGVGETIMLHIDSPAGLYDGLPALILAGDLADLGLEAAVLHYEPATAQVVAQTGSLAAPGLSVTLPVPSSWAGKRMVVQGLVPGPSPNTGLGFTTTDAHLFDVRP